MEFVRRERINEKAPIYESRKKTGRAFGPPGG
jgi:hypothetical protein